MAHNPPLTPPESSGNFSPIIINLSLDPFPKTVSKNVDSAADFEARVMNVIEKAASRVAKEFRVSLEEMIDKIAGVEVLKDESWFMNQRNASETF